MKKISPRSSPLLGFFKSKSTNNSNVGGNNSSSSNSRNSSPSTGNHDNNNNHAAFTTPSNKKNKNKSTTTAAAAGGGDTDSVGASSHVSIITKSLSKCFDNGVSMNDAIIVNDDEEKKHIISSSSNKNSNNKPSLSSRKNKNVDNNNSGASKKESSSNNNNNNNNVEPYSPSKGSHANNSNSTSNKTDQTTPLTTSTTTGERHYQSQQFAMKTGMTTSVHVAQAPQTPGSHNISSHATTANTPTTAAMAGTTTSAAVITNFWNNHAQPATQCGAGRTTAEGGGGTGGGASSPSSTAASSLHSAVAASTFTTSAKAAADAVIGLISKAENFITTSTGISPSSGSGFCSPRNSPNAMEGIPEGDDEHTDTNTNGLCGNDNHCFEFEDFGFNAFQDNEDNDDDDDDTNKKNHHQQQQQQKQQQQRSMKDETVTSIPSEQQNKGYEIRLKSTFSQIKAQEDAAKSIDQRKQQPLGAFGRTHPNYKKSISHPSDNSSNNNAKPQKSQHIFNDVPLGSSRALPDGLPFKELSVPREIEHSVSELTMRSHGAFERHKYTSDSRRMAYYAVGRTTGDDGNASKSGGNRRCYFTGNPIPYGMPFYAGSVQQGPRTLVVFCLPSALGLPMFCDIQAMDSVHQFSNKEGREKYLNSLPEPDTKLLKEMSRLYPEPFDTLPVQVRSPHCWRLFVKFCFFSGLPIAEGEMHYRVKSSVTVLSPPQQNREEIALSHEVMEAVNGEISAELLRLPNQKVFDYLKRQYSQQSSKLNDEVFDRKSWELVMSEV